MRARTRLRSVLSAGLAGTFALAAAAPIAGCDADPPAPSTTPSVSVTSPSGGAASDATQARAQLAARAAAAKDLRYAAFYTWAVAGQPDRTVAVTRAADGSWRVDIPRGALGSTADVAVARNRGGLYQCALASADRLIQPTCVRVAGPDGELAASVNPRVQHVFVDWLEVLTDRNAAIAVSTTAPLPGVGGSCFAVESNSASLPAPLDIGIYCYARNGILTGARLSFGTLTLTANPTAAPPAVTLPGPVISGEALPMASPPPPPPTTPPAMVTPSESAARPAAN